MLNSIEFVKNKDRFISYLQEFVKQLQNQSIRIEKLAYLYVFVRIRTQGKFTTDRHVVYKWSG